MKSLVAVLLWVFIFSGNAGASVPSSWNQWLEQRNDYFKKSPKSLLNVNNTIYLNEGDLAYFPLKASSSTKFKWSTDKLDSSQLVAIVTEGGVMTTFKSKQYNLLKEDIEINKDIIIGASDQQNGLYRLYVHNKRHPRLKKFPGVNYFNYNDQVRVQVDFIKDDEMKKYPFTTIRGAIKKFWKVGRVRGKVSGQEFELAAYAYADDPEATDVLFIPFKDPTNGVTTYGAGRYLSIDNLKGLPKGKVTLDFNKSTNPACAYSKYYNCVLVPGAPLPMAINAGEKYIKTPEIQRNKL